MNNTCPTCRHNLLTERRVASQNGQGENAATNASTNASTNAATNAATNASTNAAIIPIDSEININSFYNELLRNSINIPGFELNAVNDDSVVFSFDLINQNTRDIDEVD
jgi:translation initiation factor 2 gamma subunit (eIF-2gamma)